MLSAQVVDLLEEPLHLLHNFEVGQHLVLKLNLSIELDQLILVLAMLFFGLARYFYFLSCLLYT